MNEEEEADRIGEDDVVRKMEEVIDLSVNFASKLVTLLFNVFSFETFSLSLSSFYRELDKVMIADTTSSGSDIAWILDN